MNTEQIVYLEKHIYANSDLPAYRISDGDIARLKRNGVLPIFKISDNDLKELNPAPIPADAPEIAILFNREPKDYMIPADYVYSVLKAGGEPRIISFDDMERQLEGVSGIVLSGGDFDMPGEWYIDSAKKKYPPVQKRYKAYEFIINYAAENKVPMLGICAGMQTMSIILSEEKAKVYNDLYVITTIGHRPPATEIPRSATVHDIDIVKGSKFYEIVGKENVMVNSRHFQGVVPYSVKNLDTIKVTATAPDGIIEAVEFPQHPYFLGVEFHPETQVYYGSTDMLKLFTNLVKEAREYKSALEIKN
ncbi:putative glutamine amidotransferase [Elusimicrobium posterum]|uniref:gamma-glutamyl-gamma-aminobutyrate hydrolase family protein n=1 Tax=Elusimicrobium posterum TaxID=3116653 RepID=UPI003C71095B